MPMPNRNIVGDYRYGYQGQYSEKDDETGLNAFELRMYDSRIGRWTSPDPYGQFDSPYIGMGNNPISNTDPDGGCVGDDCPKIEYDTCQCSYYDDAGNAVTGITSINDALSFGILPNADADFRNPFSTIGLLSDLDRIRAAPGWRGRVDEDGLISFEDAIFNYNYGGKDLFADIGKINFFSSSLSTQDFDGVGSTLTVNFFDIWNNRPSTLWRPASDIDVGRVYGTITLKLLDVHGNVDVVIDPIANDGRFDTFDFHSFITKTAASRAGGTPTSFRIFPYGTGRIRN